MSFEHIIPVAALGASCVFTGLVLVFVLRAQRLNRADCCGVCGTQLGLESRFRFHGRTVCARCSRRVRLITMPRTARIAVLLALWSLGTAALATLIERHDPGAALWGPLFAGLVLCSVIVGVVPPLTKARDRTAATLQRLHALLQSQRGRSTDPDRS